MSQQPSSRALPPEWQQLPNGRWLKRYSGPYDRPVCALVYQVGGSELGPGTGLVGYNYTGFINVDWAPVVSHNTWAPYATPEDAATAADAWIAAQLAVPAQIAIAEPAIPFPQLTKVAQREQQPVPITTTRQNSKKGQRR